MKLIPLSNSPLRVIVDDADAPGLLALSWSLTVKRGKHYAHALTKTKKRVYMHRLIMGHPTGKLVDHINGETISELDSNSVARVVALNNRRSNLRICTRSENMGNSKPHSDRSGKYKGVYLEKSTGKYVAQICVNKVRTKIGRYATAIEAARAYDTMALLEFGEFALVNFKNELA